MVGFILGNIDRVGPFQVRRSRTGPEPAQSGSEPAQLLQSIARVVILRARDRNLDRVSRLSHALQSDDPEALVWFNARLAGKTRLLGSHAELCEIRLVDPNGRDVVLWDAGCRQRKRRDKRICLRGVLEDGKMAGNNIGQNWIPTACAHDHFGDLDISITRSTDPYQQRRLA